MKTLNILYFFLLLLVAPQVINAQDQIIKRNQEVISCKIKEIGSAEIKYTMTDYSPDVIFSIEKDKVSKVIFEDGKELTFNVSMTDPGNYEGQHKNAVKADFIAPLTGNFTISYERSLKVSRSIEATLGIIGLGIDPNDNNPAGVFTKFGYKFIKDPDFYLQGMRYAHILKGGYFKPEIAIAAYSRDFEEYDYTKPPGQEYFVERKDIFSVALLLNFGKQWVVDNSFLVDFYSGIGYGFDNNDGGYHYGYSTASSTVPITFSAGLKVGWLFK